LFVAGGGFLLAGNEELAGFVVDLSDATGDGSAVDVDVEDVEEDADAREGRGFGLDSDDFAIGG